MEYLPGHRLDDHEFLDSSGISRDEVSAALANIFNEMVFGKDAPLHCDPHGGNLAIRVNDKVKRYKWWNSWSRQRGRGFEVILYDHGLYRDIPEKLRRAYARLWLAVLDSDEAKMRRYAKEVAGITDAQFPLFASAITGRDYTVLIPRPSSTSHSQTSITTPRTSSERKAITTALIHGDASTGIAGGGALLAQIMQLLAGVPRVILLILKTNDLTRSLDEGLRASEEGGERVWLILARYCARTVFEEEMEAIHNGEGGWIRRVTALWEWYRVESRLRVFEGYVGCMRLWGWMRLKLRLKTITAGEKLKVEEKPVIPHRKTVGEKNKKEESTSSAIPVPDVSLRSISMPGVPVVASAMGMAA